MRILSIHAHPDDAEILAGGTLTLLAELKHHITIVTMTAGDCGSTKHGPFEISEIRKSEAAASAALIRADYLCAGLGDLSIFNDDPTRRKVTGLLRELRPQIVLTAAPSDYLCDHEATSQIVRDACFAASVPNYETRGPQSPLPAIPHLYFMDPIGGADRDGNLAHPNFTVDIATTFKTKKAMLSKHVSQRSWLNHQHGMNDYLSQMEEWTRLCGERARIALGEGFRQYKVHPYPAEPLLQQILASYLV